jgi:N utilization substance protein B
MSRRSRAREVALQVLYQYDLNPDTVAPIETFLRQRLGGEPRLIEFAHSLITGVRQRAEQVDRYLGSSADNWSLDRMAVTDRNVLRLGVYELFYTDTPGRVVVNEAVELAKRFGDKESPSFINGILDRLLRLRNSELAGDKETAKRKGIEARQADSGGESPMPKSQRPM